MSRREDDGLARWTLILAFIIAGLFLFVSRNDARQRQAAPMAADEITSPVLSILSKPIRSAERFVFGFQDRARAHEENKALRAELLELREKQARMEVLRMKLARYEDILGAQSHTEIPLEKIAGRAVSESNGPFVHSLLINIGRGDGVEVGNPVMSPDGLVGHVIKIGEYSSRVLKLQDLNSRIAVMSPESSNRAILSGDNSANPKLSYVSDDEDWKNGDRVITSGDDGMLPRGLPIGTVQIEPNGDFRVALTGYQNALDWVWVSPFRPIPVPTEEVIPADTLDNIAGDQ